MRITRLPALALCLSIGGLVGYGGLHDAASAAVLLPATTSAGQCQALPLPSPSPSPTPSSTPSPTPSASPSPANSPSATTSASTAALAAAAPADLCVSVQASQDTFQAGQNATWTVQVWAPNGTVTGVTVYLTGTMPGQPPAFSGKCPGGASGTTCYVGDLATAAAAPSDTLQAQITIPSGTAAGTSVTLTATANATPSLPTMPSAATAVTTTAAPAASGSASASAAGSAAATKSATTAAPGQSTVTPGTTTSGTVTLPGIGTIPALAAPGTSPTGVTAITNPGSISNLLPVIGPGPSATSPTAGFVTSPAADNAGSAGAGTTADRSGASNVVLVVPTATAEKLGVVLLLVLIAVALRMRVKDKMFPRVLPDRPSRGSRNGGSAPTRRLTPSALLHPRRQPGEGPKKT